MVTTGVVVRVATLIALWIDLCQAQYSLYISEENLQTYYSNSPHEELVQERTVYIVEDGEVRVDGTGGLLLSQVSGGSGQTGSGGLPGTEGESGEMSTSPVSPASMQALPPLPAHVDSVDFTWVSADMVIYTLYVMQEGTHLLPPLFDVRSTGTIPSSPTDLRLTVSCRPLAMGFGRIHVNLTTVSNLSSNAVSFFIDKSCYDSEGPSLSTVFLERSVAPENSISSHILTFSLPAQPTATPELRGHSPTPTVHPYTISPTPLLTVPAMVQPSFTTSHVDPFVTSTPYLLLPLPSSFAFSSPPTSDNSLSIPFTPSTSFADTHFSTSHSTSPSIPTLPIPFTSTSVSHTSLYSSTMLSRTTHSPDSTFLITVPSSLHPSVLPTEDSLSLSITPTPSVSTHLDIVASYESVRGGTTHSAAETSLSANPTVTDVGEGDTNSQLLVFVCAPLGGVLLASIVLSLCIIICIKFRATGKTAIHAFSDDPLDVVHTVPYSPSAIDDVKKTPPPISLWMSLPWGIVPSLPRSLQALVAELGVDRRSLSVIDSIARGEYGSVVSGQLNTDRTDVMLGSQSVTIKLLTGFSEGSRRDEVVRFLEAATLMKDIQHRHILPVLRVSLEDNYVPLVVYPMVEHGDMHRAIKLASDPEHTVLPPLTTRLALEMAIQIAIAMNHLTEHSIIHPDLALRNCMLDSDCTVKVSDGALAQQFHPECYYILFGATRPVRWAAVETLQEGLCTVRSNVWSYAVTVWEILTYAEMPYAEVNNNRSILSTIKMGARLPRPSTCPQPLYELLQSCWNEKGEERPSFKRLISSLQQFLDQISVQKCNGGQDRVQSGVQSGNRHSTSSVGKSVSRELLSHGGDSPQSRNLLTQRHSSQASLKRVSMASMLSRGSGADKLSVTFSVLSGADETAPSGSDSEDDGNGLELQMFAEHQEIQSMLRHVSTSFVDSPSDLTSPTVEPHTVRNDANSSIHTAALSDVSSRTLVPSSLQSPVRSPMVCVSADETSLASSNPVSLTPPPTDSQSKTSTVDLESVSTAPYTSSPLHSTAFLYPTPGSGLGSSSERGDQSPLTVDYRARSSHSPAFVPSQPSAKSTDSGIRSDEDSEATHSPNASVQNASKLEETDAPSVDARAEGDFSSSLMAAFDSW